MKPAAIALALLALLAAGCVSVPRTEVAFDPKTRSLTIRSPKDIAISNLTVTAGDGGAFTLTMGSYSSRNSAEVIGAVAAQNAATLQKVSEIGGAAVGELLKHAK